MNQPRSQFRSRISLLAILLAAIVLCLGVSHWHTSRQLATVQVELRKLRDQLGYMSIVDDKSKFHAVALDSGEPNTWRWRLFVPKGARYKWNFVCEDIPMNSPPSPAGIVGVSDLSGCLL